MSQNGRGPRLMSIMQTRRSARPVQRLFVPAVFSVLVTVGATGCGASGAGPGGAGSPDDRPSVPADVSAAVAPTSGGVVDRNSVLLDGLPRTWTTYTPPDTHGPSTPLLIVLHGTGDTGAGFREGVVRDLEREADEHGFRVAYVDGFQNNWNECRLGGRWPAKDRDLDDVGLVREVARSSTLSGPVFVVGFSSGGHMAMRLALEASDLVDGVAVVAANPPIPENNTCNESGEPVPAIFVEGRDDPINPIDGGEVVLGRGPSAISRGEVFSAWDGAGWFAARNGIAVDSAQRVEHDGDMATTTWEGAAPVKLVVVDDLGHVFPTESSVGQPIGAGRYDAAGEIWRFFTGN